MTPPSSGRRALPGPEAALVAGSTSWVITWTAAPPSRFANEAASHLLRAPPSGRVDSCCREAEPRRSRRPCHPRAISSGHERYAAVSHGHSKQAVALGSGSLTWGGGGG